MAGGIGSRFWPMSKNSYPKQFIDILGTGRTLLQQTYDRFIKICPKENIYIVTHEAYVGIVREQLPELELSQIVQEPLRRNTAPCIAYAAYKILKHNPDANMVVAPSDHIILKEDVFVDCINRAFKFSEQHNSLLTLGMHPTRPDTGYGYIQLNDKEHHDLHGVYKVKTFTEKPDHEMAKFFVQSGEFLWNAGIFVWSAKNIVEAIEEYLPEINSVIAEGVDVLNTPEEEAFIKKAYSQCTNISIDNGVMEKAQNVYVMPASFGWSDLGTWSSLYEHSNKDTNENAIVGKQVMMYDSKGCIVNVPKNKLVVIQGLEDYIVAESADGVLLICRKQEEQHIKQFVNDVKLNKGERYV